MIIKEKKKLINFLKNNKVGIIPTDTIYGFVTFWKNIDGISKIYHLKKRSLDKKIPILVASFSQLKIFIDCDQNIEKFILDTQEPTTIIYDFKKSFINNHEIKFFDQKKIAIRFVKKHWLQQIILECGPLVATSCNISNQKPLFNFQKIKIWNKNVDFIFYDQQKKQKKASKIIDWNTKKTIR